MSTYARRRQDRATVRQRHKQRELIRQMPLRRGIAGKKVEHGIGYFISHALGRFAALAERAEAGASLLEFNPYKQLSPGQAASISQSRCGSYNPHR